MEDISILVVDDEPSISKVVVRLFREEENYNIITAESAEEGLKILEETQVDLVLSDFKMPNKNGVEFLREVREKYPDILRVMYSGTEKEAMDAAGNDPTLYYSIFSKPFPPNFKESIMRLATSAKDTNI